MSGNSDFVIENGVLEKYNGPGGDVNYMLHTQNK